MEAEVTEHMTRLYLTENRSRLEHAAGVCRAADACASAGLNQRFGFQPPRSMLPSPTLWSCC